MRNVLLYCFVLLCSLHVLAGPRKIKGVVLAKDDGLPVPGASVLEKGTTNSVYTDFDGKFEISVNNKKKNYLVFSFIGLITQEIKLEKETDFYTITLEEDLGDVEEVIIIHNLDSPIMKRRDGGLPVGISAEDLRVIGAPDVNHTTEAPVEVKK